MFMLLAFLFTLVCHGLNQLPFIDPNIGKNTLNLLFLGNNVFEKNDYKDLLNIVQQELEHFGHPVEVFSYVRWEEAELNRLIESKNEWLIMTHLPNNWVQYWLNQHPQQGKVLALVLLGSTITENFRWTKDGHWHIPTLTIGGDLDGVWRPLRYAEAYFHQVLAPKELKNGQVVELDREIEKYKKPVFYLHGLSHASFTKKTFAHSFIRHYDLQNDDLKPWNKISLFISHYVNYMKNRDEKSKEFINLELEKSLQLLRPLLDALLLESSDHLLPTCADINDVNPYEVKVPCFISSHWSLFAQLQMSLGQLPNIRFNVTNEMHKAYIHFPLHIPSSNADDCVGDQCRHFNVFSASQNLKENEALHYPWDLTHRRLKHSWYTDPVSSFEIRSKMRSRQDAHFKLGNSTAKFDDYDGKVDRCSEINQLAFKWVQVNMLGGSLLEKSDSEYGFGFIEQLLNQLWEVVLKKKRQVSYSKEFQTYFQRYLKSGIRLQFQPDFYLINGGRWIWEPLDYKLKSRKLLVTSPMMRFDLNFIISSASGIHYCKLLSPLRALEWIMTDSLRSY